MYFKLVQKHKFYIFIYIFINVHNILCIYIYIDTHTLYTFPPIHGCVMCNLPLPLTPARDLPGGAARLLSAQPVLPALISGGVHS